MKKLISILLSVVVMFTLSVPAFATEPIQANQQAEIPDGFVLFDSETSFVDDGTGNLIEVTVNEYRRLIAPLQRSGKNEFILSTYLILLWELYLGSLVLL